MSKRQSEISRFLNFYDNPGEEAKKIVADQVRDAFRQDQPKRRALKNRKVFIPADSQIEKKA